MIQWSSSKYRSIKVKFKSSSNRYVVSDDTKEIAAFKDKQRARDRAVKFAKNNRPAEVMIEGLTHPERYD